MRTDQQLASACLAFLEAAYAWELDERAWLGRLTEAMAQVWGGGPWTLGWLYDASDPDFLRYGSPVFWQVPMTVRDLVHEAMPRHQRRQEVIQMYRTMTMGFGRPVNANDADADTKLQKTGILDIFGINGSDASGLGCFIGVGAERFTLAAHELLMFQRLAMHLSSAYRCRRRLQAAASPLTESEAVLSVDGKVLDAKGPAETRTARESLRDATRSIQALRRHTRKDDPTSRWRPRVHGRWTLIDATDRQGNTLVAARENQSRPLGLQVLTEREREVVASAIAGRTPKEIAYDLGISYATTRVLLARAYNRLGVRDRKELFALPSIRALRGVPMDAPVAETS